jgi:raffinose/stachyose/melibiose transport system permease protein
MSTNTTVAKAVPIAKTSRRRRRLKGRNPWVIVGLSVVALVWVLPFFLLVLSSIRPLEDFQRFGPISWPRTITVDNFLHAWTLGNFATTYKNSLIITIIKVPLGVLLSAMIAFPLAKMRIRFRRAILFAVVLGLTVPIYIVLVPLFSLVRDLHLIDNLFGLLGPYLGFGIPFTVLVLHAFFRRLPDEIFEAARVDGAGPWRIFFQILLPLSSPVLITVLVLDAVATWNELLMALTILSSDKSKTLPLGMLNFAGQYTTDYSGLAAGILVAVIPMLIAYAFLQRHIVSGLTAGAVKG